MMAPGGMGGPLQPMGNSTSHASLVARTQGKRALEGGGEGEGVDGGSGWFKIKGLAFCDTRRVPSMLTALLLLLPVCAQCNPRCSRQAQRCAE